MYKNKRLNKSMTPWLAAPLALFMVACGGGGDSTPSFDITTSAGNGGSISPGQMTVKEGNSATFRINPLTGFEINQVSGCNGQLNDRNYVISDVTQNCQVSASFDPLTYELDTEFHFSEQPGTDYALPTLTPRTTTIDFNQQQSFSLRLPDQNWTFQEADGCPVDNIQFENQSETEITITTAPILESCTLNVYIEVPDPNLEFEVSTDVMNGEALIDGASFDSAMFSYGEQITIDFIPFGERNLTNLSSVYTNCKYVSEGASVHITVTSRCYFSTEFLGENEHYFADDTLLQAFRDKWELEPEVLLTADLVAAVEEITLAHDSLRIFSLEGIEAASRLNTLSFRSYGIDFEPLLELALENLHIEINNYGAADIELLVDLPLKELSLTYLNIEPDEYQVLSKLTGLEYLNLSSNSQLHRIDFVEHMPQLRDLYLGQTGVLDIRPILQSGLAVAGGNGHLQINGCASLEQSVTRDVLAELQANGVSTSASSRSNWALCPSANDYYEGSLNASLDGRALTLNWDINAADGDLACALYFNLYAQQPRVIDAMIEQCGTTGSATLDVDLDIQKLDLYIEDGLFPNPARVASVQVDDSLNDSSQLRLAAVDWGQSTFKSNPYLVPGRGALLRAHVIADDSPEAPTMDARLYLNGESRDFTLTAPQSISAAPVFDSLDASYQLEMPADWMQDGLQVELRMDDQLVYTTRPTFADPTTLYITIVPMVVDDVAPEIPSNAALEETIKTYWPVGDVVIERRDPFIVERSGESMRAHDLLYMVRDLHAQEGALHYYHGLFNLEVLGNKEAAGVAFRPGLVGVSFDRPSGIHQTFAHELGHNFSVGHIDCGGPSGLEIHYPYDPEIIGSVGIDYDFTTIYRSDEVADVMSYCWPKFISDWVYEKAQDYLTVYPPQPFNASQSFDAMTLAQPTFSTYVSGVIDQVQGQSEILSHFELSQPAGRENYGPFIMIATDSQGQQTERRFAIEQTSESTSENNGYFNVRLPAFDIRQVQIFHQGREILSTQL